MSKLKILVARAIFPETLTRLENVFDVESNQEDQIWTGSQLVQKLSGKQGVLTTGSERIDAGVLRACPDLRICANMAVGYDNFDLDALTEYGVLGTNTPDVLTETTADFGFALLMATARRITEGERFLRRGEWSKWSYDLFTGTDIHGSTIGIIGMGRIGQGIAKRAAFGFGMKVIYHNVPRLHADIETDCRATYVGKEPLFKTADHIVLGVPHTAETHHMIGAHELSIMKPTATLVNIARGGVVDDKALAKALRERRIAAAGLDVFEGEPDVHPDLLEASNVVLTPHIASASMATRRAMADLAAANLIEFLSGRQAPTAIRRM